MRTLNTWTTLPNRHTREGHYNPSKLVVVEWDEREWTLGADMPSAVFIPNAKNDEGLFYVLSLDRRLESVGMGLFHLRASEHSDGYEAEYMYEPIGEVFSQNEWEIEEILGPKGLDYADITIAKRLGHYLDETSF